MINMKIKNASFIFNIEYDAWTDTWQFTAASKNM